MPELDANATTTAATDVNAQAATVADKQESAQDVSSTSETKELEVVHEGAPVKVPTGTEEVEEDSTEAESDETRDKSEKAEGDETDTDQPLEENKRNSQTRIRQLNAELKETRAKLEEVLARKNPEYDVDKAIADGTDEALAEIEAVKHDRLNEKLATKITELNLDLTQQAADVDRDFPYMDSSNKDRTPEDAEFAALVTDLWFEASGAKIEKDDESGTQYFTEARIPLYDFVNKMHNARESRYKSGETSGQRNAERQLSAVEIPTGAAPKRDRSDDANLSPEAYAKKHNLDTV